MGLFFSLYSISDDICNETITTENTEENNTLELHVGKTFGNWDHAAKFMKRYTAAKGHGIRIGGGGKVNKETKEVIK